MTEFKMPVCAECGKIIIVKEMPPQPRKMAREYAMLFSGGAWLILLGFLGIVVVSLLIWLYGPSTIDEQTNIVLRLGAMLNAFVLFIGFPVWLYMILTPLIARMIIPAVILALELIKGPFTLVQFLLYAFVIQVIVTDHMYPKEDSERPAGAPPREPPDRE